MINAYIHIIYISYLGLARAYWFNLIFLAKLNIELSRNIIYIYKLKYIYEELKIEGLSLNLLVVDK